MRKRRAFLRASALVAALTLVLSLAWPLPVQKAEAGITIVPFLAFGNGFECGLFIINFFNTVSQITIDTAVATRRTNVVQTFDVGAFEGVSISCAGLAGIANDAFMSVFLRQAASLPVSAFGFIILPASLGGGVVVPPNMYFLT